MRCEVKREDPRLRALVALLDEGQLPFAHTWRVVAAAAETNGMLRPSYPLIRRLARHHRRLVRRRAELRALAQRAAVRALAARSPGFDFTAHGLEEAVRRLREEEACVSETQAPLGPFP